MGVFAPYSLGYHDVRGHLLRPCTSENVAGRLKFLGWTERPKVLTEVRERANAGRVAQERGWPIARTEYVPRHPGAATGTLADKPPPAETRGELPGPGRRRGRRDAFGYRFT
ncbi:hypothetical protein QWJ26_19205 [Streptomyces sp. CSDS2]|uniref:hypothetical protein n=1 Tax=Streptomyces sp. CSDS2 TaxID=3055051 RepID=UPI0025B09CCA|nr:hypothetical protein [Streptomyces sp. CSDS2]MDN3261902.1 hypothetical protein [Streptomyces sp. CSDS2]